MVGGGGNDIFTLFPSNGNPDTIADDPTWGDDTIRGGSGTDSINFPFAAEGGSDGVNGVNVNLATGIATGGDGPPGSSVTLFSIEEVYGSSFADTLTGGGSNDLLAGQAGGDSIAGRGGNDTLAGEGGRDTLNGGSGDDTLTGGAGADKFIFNSALNAATNVDTIGDFAPGVDRMQLDQTFFAGLPTGNLAPGRFHSVPGATAANDANDRIVYDSASGNLYYDADGNGAVSSAVLFATLTGAPAITAADFFIIA
jgi:serralysin